MTTPSRRDFFGDDSLPTMAEIDDAIEHVTGNRPAAYLETLCDYCGASVAFDPKARAQFHGECRTRVGVDGPFQRVPLPDIFPGVGVTYQSGADSYPFTVLAVTPSQDVIVVQADSAVRLDKNGQSEYQTYRYERDHASSDVRILRPVRRGAGRGSYKVGDGSGIWSFFGRAAYRDPSR